MKRLYFLLLICFPMLAGCAVVTTTAALGGAAISLAGTAVSVTTTAAGLAWDVGAAGVSGATALAEYATASSPAAGSMPSASQPAGS